MPIVESDISLVRSCILVRVLLKCTEPGGCEIGTCCIRTTEDELTTELTTNILRVQETQSFINRGWVRPGHNGILDVRADACQPSSHPLCAGKQRVGRTTTKSQ